MELTLSLQASTTVAVSCDEGPSHTYDLNRLLPGAKLAGPLDDPLAYGDAVYQALFPPKSLAARLLDSELKRPAGQRRLLLVASNANLEAISWEYARSAENWLVCELPFVRGLPASERRPAPVMENGMHVAALLSNPLGKDITPLDIEGEWQRLVEVFDGLQQAAVLERVRPATLSELRRRLAGSRQRVVHFIGHAIPPVGEAALLFENETGAATAVSGRELVSRLGDTIFLAVLNDCASAEPSPTGLAALRTLGVPEGVAHPQGWERLAAALVKQGVPYALGMRFAVEDPDASLLARSLYSELGRGVPLEQAVWQMRLQLQGSRHGWLVGVPVLYTSLQTPAAGFASSAGAAQVEGRQMTPAVAPTPPAVPPTPPAAGFASGAGAAQVEDPQVTPAVLPTLPAVPPTPPAAPASPLRVRQSGEPPVAHLNNEQLQMIVRNTLVALTSAPDKLPQWRTGLRTSYQQAQRTNAQAEIELFAALLALLDGVQPNLPADNPYTGMVMAILQALVKARGEAPTEDEDSENIPEELAQAVQALLQAQELPALRQVIEQHQKELFTTQAVELLDSLANEANTHGSRQDAQVLAFYATLLQRCRQAGIPAVFAELAQSAAAGAPAPDEDILEAATPPTRVVTPAGAALPPDFVARCAAGLHGGKPEREALFNYLAEVPVTDPGCAALLKDLKLWLLGSNPHKLGQKLEGPYAEAWQEILSQV